METSPVADGVCPMIQAHLFSSSCAIPTSVFVIGMPLSVRPSMTAPTSTANADLVTQDSRVELGSVTPAQGGEAPMRRVTEDEFECAVAAEGSDSECGGRPVASRLGAFKPLSVPVLKQSANPDSLLARRRDVVASPFRAIGRALERNVGVRTVGEAFQRVTQSCGDDRRLDLPKEYKPLRAALLFYLNSLSSYKSPNAATAASHGCTHPRYAYYRRSIEGAMMRAFRDVGSTVVSDIGGSLNRNVGHAVATGVAVHVCAPILDSSDMARWHRLDGAVKPHVLKAANVTVCNRKFQQCHVSRSQQTGAAFVFSDHHVVPGDIADHIWCPTVVINHMYTVGHFSDDEVVCDVAGGRVVMTTRGGTTYSHGYNLWGSEGTVEGKYRRMYYQRVWQTPDDARLSLPVAVWVCYPVAKDLGGQAKDCLVPAPKIANDLHFAVLGAQGTATEMTAWRVGDVYATNDGVIYPTRIVETLSQHYEKGITHIAGLLRRGINSGVYPVEDVPDVLTCAGIICAHGKGLASLDVSALKKSKAKFDISVPNVVHSFERERIRAVADIAVREGGSVGEIARKTADPFQSAGPRPGAVVNRRAGRGAGDDKKEPAGLLSKTGGTAGAAGNAPLRSSGGSAEIPRTREFADKASPRTDTGRVVRLSNLDDKAKTRSVKRRERQAANAKARTSKGVPEVRAGAERPAVDLPTQRRVSCATGSVDSGSGRESARPRLDRAVLLNKREGKKGASARRGGGRPSSPNGLQPIRLDLPERDDAPAKRNDNPNVRGRRGPVAPPSKTARSVEGASRGLSVRVDRSGERRPDNFPRQHADQQVGSIARFERGPSGEGRWVVIAA